MKTKEKVSIIVGKVHDIGMLIEELGDSIDFHGEIMMDDEMNRFDKGFKLGVIMANIATTRSCLNEAVNKLILEL